MIDLDRHRPAMTLYRSKDFGVEKDSFISKKLFSSYKYLSFEKLISTPENIISFKGMFDAIWEQKHPFLGQRIFSRVE
jgi:hypothetical protein